MWTFILTTSFLIQVVLGGFPYTTPTVGSPWPLPQNEQQGQGSIVTNSAIFSFVSTDNDCDILQNAYQRYLNILSKQAKVISRSFHVNSIHGPSKDRVPFSFLGVSVLQPCEDYPYLGMDEQYELKICTPDDPAGASLISRSVWGALRGLETFSQLGIAVGDGETIIFNCTKILDFPRFSHRYLPTELRDSLDNKQGSCEKLFLSQDTLIISPDGATLCLSASSRLRSAI